MPAIKIKDIVKKKFNIEHFIFLIIDIKCCKKSLFDILFLERALSILRSKGIIVPLF